MNSWIQFKLWLTKMGSPPAFFNWSSKYLYLLGFLSIVILSYGLFWGLFYAPADYKQGDVYRIIFIHVPAAIISQSILLMMAIFGFICIVWRAKIAGMFVRSAAPVGASFTFLALISGSIWGYPTWGTWWVWDARLTSTLFLFFIYTSIIALYSSIDKKPQGDRVISLLSLVGILIIPIIKKSVDWWQTLHQPSTFSLTSAPSMAYEMYLPLVVCVLGSYLFFFFIIFLRLRTEILYREINTNWVNTYLLSKVKK